jgi:hypothetical protein
MVTRLRRTRRSSGVGELVERAPSNALEMRQTIYVTATQPSHTLLVSTLVVEFGVEPQCLAAV